MKTSSSQIPWKFIIILFLGLRVVSILAQIFGSHFLNFKASFPYSELLAEKYKYSSFWNWANFDGIHYIRIAQDGYVFGLTQAFFPGYPLFIRVINPFINNYLISGLLISHIFFVLSLLILYKLVCLDFTEKIARLTLLFLTFFPTSFYFLSVYTESLYLFLTLLFFYTVRKNFNIKSSLVGGIASAVRLTGIFLLPSLGYEIYLKNKNNYLNFFKLVRSYWHIVLILLGLLVYMFYLQINYKDPLLFFHVQSGFSAGRQTDKLILFYQVIWRYIKMILTVDKNNPIYFTVWLEFVSTLSFLGLLIWGYFKKIRLSYLIYGLFCLLLPTLTGTLSSMPRYVLTIFPAFIVLATIKNRLVSLIILGINIILLIICTALFTQGYWVA